MTNATVAKIGAEGKSRTLTLIYKGGEQTVVVPEATPIVMIAPGDLSSLSAGAHVIVYASRGADGMLAARRIDVGKDGSVPPI